MINNKMNNNFNNNNPNFNYFNSPYGDNINNYQPLNEYNKPQSVSQANDLNILDSILEENRNFTTILSNRIKGLQNVASSWTRGDKEESLAAITSCKDLGVVNDFLNNILIKKELTKVSLKSDHAIQIFPIILVLGKAKYDVYFRNSIQAAWVILKLFYDVIIEAKNTPFVSGIDLNREDRVKKYDILVEYFSKLKDLDTMRNHLRKGTKFEGLNLNQFIAELEYFLKLCRGNPK